VAEKGEEGTDTVTVEAFEVHGDDRISLGTSSATIKVTKDQFSVTLAPANPQIAPGRDVEVTARITPPIAAETMGTYVFRWQCTGKLGELAATNDYLTYADHTRYTAGQTEGTDDIFFEVIHVMGDQHVVEGRAMTTVTVRSEGVTLSASKSSPTVGEAIELTAGYPAAPGETILYAFACEEAETPSGQLVTDSYGGAQAVESQTAAIGYWPRRAETTSIRVEVFSISGAGRTSRGTASVTLSVQALTVPIRFQEWQIYSPAVGGQYYVCESYFAFPGPPRTSAALGKRQFAQPAATFRVDFHGNASRPASWEDGVLVTLGQSGWMGSTPSPVQPSELYQPVQADDAENPDRRPLSAAEWDAAKAAARQRCEDACRGWTATLEAIDIVE